MENVWKQIQIYHDFKQKIKKIKNEINNNIEYTEYQCLVTTKDDIHKWKQYCEYDKSPFGKEHNYDEWDNKMKFNTINLKKPKLKLLKTFNEFKNNFSKGISVINKELYLAVNTSNSKITNNIIYYVGNNKILLKLLDNGNTFFICIIGKRDNVKYVTFENMNTYKRSIIKEIINAENNILIDKKFIYQNAKFVCNVYKKFQNKKEKNNVKIKIDNKNYIHDHVLKILILYYGLNIDLDKKKSNKIKECEKYYLINYEWMKQFQKCFNYSKLIIEIKKNTKYNSLSDFENNIESLLNKFKNALNDNKEYNKDLEDLKNIQINPIEVSFTQSLNHFTNFTVINSKIYNTIRENKMMFGFDNYYSKEYSFFFYPITFYQGKRLNFIEIGFFNDENVFISKYYINTLNQKLAEEIKSFNNINQFSEKYQIEIEQPEEQNLIKEKNNIIGTIINLNYCSCSTVTEDNKNKNKKKNVKMNSNIITNNKPLSSSNKNNINIKTSIDNNKKQNNKINNNNNTKSITNNYKSNNNNNNNIINIDIFNNNINNNDEEIFYNKITKIKDNKITPMIGLQNIGQTCYMNSALQCFSHTETLANYLINPNKLSIINNNSIAMIDPDLPQLSPILRKLILHLWSDKPKSAYAPNDFKRIVGEIEPLFKDFQANDAKDFVNFIIMKLHEELNLIDNSFSNSCNITLPNQPINPYNSNQVLMCYFYDFQMNLKSIISNIFYGTIQSEFECQNCKMQLYLCGQTMPLIKYNYQNYFFINFPLEEVRKYIVSNQMLYMKYMNMGINPNKEVFLVDCFDYYQKDDPIIGYCDRCNNDNAQIITRTKLFTLPIYLIILLNRGTGIQFNIKLDFPEILSSNGIAINPSGNYLLYGVVKHFGDSSSSGHFAAYCRSPIDNQWYFYNDSIVTPINENEKGRIQDVGLTYILFYRKMN